MAKSLKFTSPLSFNFDRTTIQRMRNNSKVHFEKVKDILIVVDRNHKVSSWNKYTSCLIRIDETLDYINSLKLGNTVYKAAFDLYEFIMHCDVVINSIMDVAKIFDVDYEENITKNIDCFGEAVFDNESDTNSRVTIKKIPKANDEKFWKYIRSLSAIHPTDTTHSNFIDEYAQNKLHISPFASWNYNNQAFNLLKFPRMNVVVTVWKGDYNSNYSHIIFDTSMIERYIAKWIVLLNKIEEKVGSL